MYNREQWADRAHNIFLDQLVNSGIVGLIAYLAIYVFALISIWKSTLTIYQKSLIAGLLFGYVVHDIFVFDTLSSYVFFFAVLAFIDAHRKKISKLPMGKSEIAEKAIKYVIIPTTSVLLILTVYFAVARPFFANIYLGTANGICSKADPDIAKFEKVRSFDSFISKQF